MIRILISFLVYSICGTILHFIYKFSKKNIVFAIFSAVNESVWEHIKILLTPIFFYNTILYEFKYQNNYFLMLFTQLILAIFLIIIFYKIKIYLFKNKYGILNIISFYVTSFICSLIGYIISNLKPYNLLNLISIFGVIMIFIFYMTFTICPPRCELFKDPITKKYGIEV